MPSQPNGFKYRRFQHARARLAQRERAAEADGKALRAVAERFWAARVSEDWKVVYEHLPAKVRGEEGWEAWAEWAAAESRRSSLNRPIEGKSKPWMALVGNRWRSGPVFGGSLSSKLENSTATTAGERKTGGTGHRRRPQRKEKGLPAKPSTRDLLAEELV